MSLADNLVHLASNMQNGVKLASVTVSQRVLRIVTGLFLGMIISLIVQEFSGSGTVSFVFLSVVILALVYRALRSLTLVQILVFDLICILVAVSLRMYIMIAPNMS